MKCFFNKKDSFIVVVPISRRSFLWKNYEWTFLRKVHNTCRRGPHLCPCSPQLPKSKLVERTSGVSRPLTCYRCQQGCTISLEIGRVHLSSYILNLERLAYIHVALARYVFLCSFLQEYNSCNYTYTGDKTL
jgi:hypothetical protein